MIKNTSFIKLDLINTIEYSGSKWIINNQRFADFSRKIIEDYCEDSCKNLHNDELSKVESLMANICTLIYIDLAIAVQHYNKQSASHKSFGQKENLKQLVEITSWWERFVHWFAKNIYNCLSTERQDKLALVNYIDTLNAIIGAKIGSVIDLNSKIVPAIRYDMYIHGAEQHALNNSNTAILLNNINNCSEIRNAQGRKVASSLPEKINIIVGGGWLKYIQSKMAKVPAYSEMYELLHLDQGPQSDPKGPKSNSTWLDHIFLGDKAITKSCVRYK